MTFSTHDRYATIQSSPSDSRMPRDAATTRSRSPIAQKLPQLWRQSSLISNETLVDDISGDIPATAAQSDGHRWSVWTTTSTTFLSDFYDEVTLIPPAQQPLEDKVGFDYSYMGAQKGELISRKDVVSRTAPPRGEEEEEAHVTSLSRHSSTCSTPFTLYSKRCEFSTDSSSTPADNKDRSDELDAGLLHRQNSATMPWAITPSPSDVVLDTALTSTMLALEAANSLLISTMEGRARLVKMRALENELAASLKQREQDLQRSLDRNSAMSEAIDRVSAELDEMLSSTAPRPAAIRSGNNWKVQSPKHAEINVHYHSAPLEGIFEAQDRNASIGRSAMKRLERVLGANHRMQSAGDSDIKPPSKAAAANTTATRPADARSLLASIASSSTSASEGTGRISSESATQRQENKRFAFQGALRLASPSQSAGPPSAMKSLMTRSLPSAARETPVRPAAALSVPTISLAVEPIVKTFHRARNSFDPLRPASTPPPQAARSASTSGCAALLIRSAGVPESRSTLSDAFGGNKGGSGDERSFKIASASNELPNATDGDSTPNQRSIDIPPSVLFPRKRSLSSLHTRTPSVIKPSTVASSEWTAYNALASQTTATDNDWRIGAEMAPMVEGYELGVAKGRGALAALKLLNQQTADGTERPERLRCIAERQV